jgi:hypothetical protein
MMVAARTPVVLTAARNKAVIITMAATVNAARYAVVNYYPVIASVAFHIYSLS